VFDKGSLLYGLDRARQAIRAEGRAVVVEGYMDTLALHQHGFLNAVATLGTAITERHLDQLKRLTSEVVLALDPDSAGRLATQRGIEVARAMAPDEVVPEIAVEVGRGGGLKTLIRYRDARKTRLKVAVLPAGMDPDELVQHDPNAWRTLVSAAEPVVDFALHRLGERHDLQSAEGKRAASDEGLVLIRELSDPIERAHYVQRLARILRVAEADLSQRLGRRGGAERPRHSEDTQGPGDPLDEHALALAMKLGPDAWRRIAPNRLETTEARAVLAQLAAQPATEAPDPTALAALSGPSLESLLGRLGEHARLWDELGEDAQRRRFDDLLLRMEERALFREQRQLQELMGDSDDADGSRWLARLAMLTQQIQAVQRARVGQRQAGSIA
jgi:DNA primase